MVVVVVVVVVGSFSLLQRLARQKHVLILDWKQSEGINATKFTNNIKPNQSLIQCLKND